MGKISIRRAIVAPCDHFRLKPVRARGGHVVGGLAEHVFLCNADPRNNVVCVVVMPVYPVKVPCV